MSTPGYSHTQRGPLCLLLYGSALCFLAFAWGLRDTPAIFSTLAGAILFALFGPTFHYLSVEDQGEFLLVQFGPIPLFRRRVRYADIEQVEVGRTLILEGWGIHWTLRGGWIWNVWGRDCVLVQQKKSKLRIGTDDAENLAAFLRRKIAEQRTSEKER